MDANFRLKMKERYVEGDSALGPGWAYFVNPGPYYEQLGQQDKKDIHKIEVSNTHPSAYLELSRSAERFVWFNVPGLGKSYSASKRWISGYWCWCSYLCA